MSRYIPIKQGLRLTTITRIAIRIMSRYIPIKQGSFLMLNAELRMQNDEFWMLWHRVTRKSSGNHIVDCTLVVTVYSTIAWIFFDYGHWLWPWPLLLLMKQSWFWSGFQISMCNEVYPNGSFLLFASSYLNKHRKKLYLCSL